MRQACPELQAFPHPPQFRGSVKTFTQAFPHKLVSAPHPQVPLLHEAPLPQQVYSAWHKVVRLSLPNGWLDQTTARTLPSQLKRLYQMSTGGPKVRRALQARMAQEQRRAVAA